MRPAISPFSVGQVPTITHEPNLATVVSNVIHVAVSGNDTPCWLAPFSPLLMESMYRLALKDPADWYTPIARRLASGAPVIPGGPSNAQLGLWDARRRVDLVDDTVREMASIFVSSGRVYAPSFRAWYQDILAALGAPLTATATRLAPLGDCRCELAPPDAITGARPIRIFPVFGVTDTLTMEELAAALGLTVPELDTHQTASQFAAPPGPSGAFMTPLPLHPWTQRLAYALMAFDAGRITMRLMEHAEEIDGLLTRNKPFGEVANIEQMLRTFHGLPLLYMAQATILQIGVTQSAWEAAALATISTDPGMATYVSDTSRARAWWLARPWRHPIVSYVISAFARATLSSVAGERAPLHTLVGYAAGDSATPALRNTGDVSLRAACRAVSLAATSDFAATALAHSQAYWDLHFVDVADHIRPVSRLLVSADPITAMRLYAGAGRVTGTFEKTIAALAWQPVHATSPIDVRSNGGDCVLTDGRGITRVSADVITGHAPVFALKNSRFGGLSARRQDYIEKPRSSVYVLELPSRRPATGSPERQMRLFMPVSADMGRDDTYQVSVDAAEFRIFEATVRNRFAMVMGRSYAADTEVGTIDEALISAASAGTARFFQDGLWETAVVAVVGSRSAAQETSRAISLIIYATAVPPEPTRWIFLRRHGDAPHGVRSVLVTTWDGTADAFDMDGRFVTTISPDWLVTFDHTVPPLNVHGDPPALIAAVRTVAYRDGTQWDALNEVPGPDVPLAQDGE